MPHEGWDSDSSLVLIEIYNFMISCKNGTFCPQCFLLDKVGDTCQTLNFISEKCNIAWRIFFSFGRVSLGRILAGCYWFCILIWVSTYTANLAAFFTVTNTDHPVNNLEDIVKSSYHVAVVDSSSTHEAFKTSQYESHEKIWNRIKEENTTIQDTPEGVQLVRDRNDFAFIGDGPILKLAAIQPPCGLTTGKIHPHSLIKVQWVPQVSRFPSRDSCERGRSPSRVKIRANNRIVLVYIY